MAVILNLYSRAVVGWAMRKGLDSALATNALTIAIERRGAAPDILHQDQGALYPVAEFRASVARLGIGPSMSRKAHWQDNAPMESFFHTFKTKLVHHFDDPTRKWPARAYWNTWRCTTTASAGIRL